MSYVLVCPSPPDSNGDCSEALVWVEMQKHQFLTYAEFQQALPAIIAVLLMAYGIKLLMRQIFNR